MNAMPNATPNTTLNATINSVLESPVVTDRSWLARLDLQFNKTSRGTRLTRSRHVGPLYVQKPFYPEGSDLAHVYLLHPPGGLVSGDHLQINIEAKEGTGVLVTTPGAARIYRARDEQPLQRQSVALDVASNASLEWFPLETIVYNSAHVELDTVINLSNGSRFMGWEINCFGLPASDAPFVSGTFQQHYRILRDGRPLFIDRFLLTDNNREHLLSGQASMHGQAVNGFFLAGPCDVNVGEEVVSEYMVLLRKTADSLGLAQCAAISKVGEFFIGRYLGDSADKARRIFTAWWEILRPLVLERDACAPRIWST